MVKKMITLVAGFLCINLLAVTTGEDRNARMEMRASAQHITRGDSPTKHFFQLILE